MASNPAFGVGRSGCPMFKWYTFRPLAFAESDNGASFLIGELGISIPRSDISGICL